MTSQRSGSHRSFLNEDPIRRAVDAALSRLDAGASGQDVESEAVDCKEDPSARGRHGELLMSPPDEDERAALVLADHAACMANSGGGALIVGVADASGDPIGTGLNEAWLRRRIWELTDRRLTCSVEPVQVRSQRLLVVLSPAAQELLRVRGKAKHRVGNQCVEIDSTTWAARQQQRSGYDWSAEPSTVEVSAVRPQALDVVRSYLRDAGEGGAEGLAAATDADLLRRLDVLREGNVLSRAGALLLTAEARRVLLDYRRRDVPGGDSRQRLERSDRSLIEVLAEVEQAIDLANPATHLPGGGLVIGQVRALPPTAVREALANAIAHRDWLLVDPVAAELTGQSLVVQSPGGFVEGVDTQRLLTTPPRTRNPALADLLRRLRVAEREGVGVDRMYREMVRLGHAAPSITERPGPHVRCVLQGGTPDARVLGLMAALEPPTLFDDVDVALLVMTLRQQPTVNSHALAEVLQKEPAEAAGTLAAARDARFRGGPLVVPTRRTQRYREPDHRFGPTAREHLGLSLPYWRSSLDDVAPHVADFITRHGRIQNADYVELFGVSAPHAGAVLSRLASAEGGELLRPGRQPNRGRDAHYVAGPGMMGDRTE